jgi:cytochrome c553
MRVNPWAAVGVPDGARYPGIQVMDYNPGFDGLNFSALIYGEKEKMKIASLTTTCLLVFLLCLIVFARPALVSGSAPSAGELSAAQLYSKNCSSCHGRDGHAKGLRGKHVGARNLTDAQWQDRVSDERIFNSINNGKGKMPAYGKKLSEAQVNSLVNYVRSLKK